MWKSGNNSVTTQSVPSGTSGAAHYSIRAFRVAKAFVLPAVERASEYSSSRVPELQTLNCSVFPLKMKLLVLNMRAWGAFFGGGFKYKNFWAMNHRGSKCLKCLD